MMAALKVKAQTTTRRDAGGNHLGHISVNDSHAEPLASAGDMVFYDKNTCQPIAGQLYVTASDKGKYYVVMCQVVDGYCYAALPNYKALGKKVIGPMEYSFFQSKILGRVVSVLSPSHARRAA